MRCFYFLYASSLSSLVVALWILVENVIEYLICWAEGEIDVENDLLIGWTRVHSSPNSAQKSIIDWSSVYNSMSAEDFRFNFNSQRNWIWRYWNECGQRQLRYNGVLYDNFSFLRVVRATLNCDCGMSVSWGPTFFSIHKLWT